ncbi:TPA: winged helix-turn-helix transcriptional regulator [Clostridioides difficile]|nr:winged helix-turn-helix transcriptional regulator [Clostridioides difficile]
MEFSNDEQYQQIIEWLSAKAIITQICFQEEKNDFYMNPYTRTITIKNKQPVYLTAKEFDLLHFMYSHKGQVFTKEQLYENVWGYDDMPDTKNLTSFIRKLRKKIEPHPDNPQYILTVWGVGYKFSNKKP